MSEIRVKENESLESAQRRFKRKTARDGILAEARKREHYEKPSVKRKKKSEKNPRKRGTGASSSIQKIPRAEERRCAACACMR